MGMVRYERPWNKPKPKAAPEPPVAPPQTGVRGRWRDDVDWWTDPRLAYAAGMQDGVELALEHRDALDDADWRATVRQLFRDHTQENRAA